MWAGVERTRAWVALRGATAPAREEALRVIGCREELQGVCRREGEGGVRLKNAENGRRFSGRERRRKIPALLSLFAFRAIFLMTRRHPRAGTKPKRCRKGRHKPIT